MQKIPNSSIIVKIHTWPSSPAIYPQKQLTTVAQIMQDLWKAPDKYPLLKFFHVLNQQEQR